jgi:UDP-glucuronate decarboxylase
VINTDHIGNGAVKIANSHKFTMPELAVTILRSSNSRSKLVFVPLPSDDPKQRQPDVALAKAKLSRKPKVNLKDDLKRQFLIFQGH